MKNIRTYRTRARLRDALLSCMAEKPYRDITVTEICQWAGVNRTTFYKHYRNTDELIRDMERDQLEHFRRMLVEKKKTGRPLLQDILKSINRAEELYHVEEGYLLPESFKTGLISVAKGNGVQSWKEKIPNVDPREAEIVYEALLAGFLQTVLSADNKADREMIVTIIMDVLNTYIAAHQS